MTALPSRRIFLFFLLLIFFSIFLYGLVGVLVPKERIVYCTLSGIITQRDCPSQNEPIARAIFNIRAFKSVFKAQNRLQVLFDILASITASFSAPATIIWSLLPIFFAFIFIHRITLQEHSPYDLALRLKLRRWSQEKIQSPALIRA